MQGNVIKFYLVVYFKLRSICSFKSGRWPITIEDVYLKPLPNGLYILYKGFKNGGNANKCYPLKRI